MYDFNQQVAKELKQTDMLLSVLPEPRLSAGYLEKRTAGNRVRYLYRVRYLQDGNRITKSRKLSGAQAFRIKKDRYTAALRKRLLANQKLLNHFLLHYQPYDPQELWNSLPLVYRPDEQDLLRNSVRTAHTPAPIPGTANHYLKLPMRIDAQPDASSRFGAMLEELLPDEEVRTYKASLQLPQIRITNYVNTTEFQTPHYSLLGTLVRSKGEALIASTLEALGIEYLFDRGIELENDAGQTVIRYLDFIICCPDGFIIVWEHLGLLLQEKYSKDTAEKLHLYARNGITPGNNLILTSDYTNGTIDGQVILQLIECFILPHFR